MSRDWSFYGPHRGTCTQFKDLPYAQKSSPPNTIQDIECAKENETGIPYIMWKISPLEENSTESSDSNLATLDQ